MNCVTAIEWNLHATIAGITAMPWALPRLRGDDAEMGGRGEPLDNQALGAEVCPGTGQTPLTPP